MKPILITGGSGEGKTLLANLIALGYGTHVLRCYPHVLDATLWTYSETAKYDCIIIEAVKDYTQLAASYAKCNTLWMGRRVQFVFISQQDLLADGLPDFQVVRACYREYHPLPLNG